MKYYVKDNGKTYGPIEAAKIVNAISDGFFSPSCMLSPDRKDWLLFRQVMPNAAIRPVNQSTAASVEQMPAIKQPVYPSAPPRRLFQ